ncbi:purple acid phosphatase [Kappamyces sp. JEL0829]|nr:purple acid phosphatase [Kappamyces sp. JEL0829]
MSAHSAKTPLVVRNDKFKILQLADLHYENDPSNIYHNQRITGELLDLERPDLVLFSGDQLSGWAVKNYSVIYGKVVAELQKRDIPWLAILGNHDRESDLEPKDILKLDASFDLSYTQAVPGLVNSGNLLDYIVPIVDELHNPLYWLVCMDSGRSECNGREDNAGCISSDQLEWLSSTFTEELHQNKTSLGFVHQPFAEFNSVYHYYSTFGLHGESVGCPRRDSGAYSVFASLPFHSIYVGHDHNNDYQGQVNGNGPRLTYGRKTGYGSYGPDQFARGARVIELDRDGKTVSTWIRTAVGVEKDPAEHAPQPGLYRGCGEAEYLLWIRYSLVALTLLLLLVVLFYYYVRRRACLRHNSLPRWRVMVPLFSRRRSGHSRLE